MAIRVAASAQWLWARIRIAGNINAPVPCWALSFFYVLAMAIRVAAGAQWLRTRVRVAGNIDAPVASGAVGFD